MKKLIITGLAAGGIALLAGCGASSAPAAAPGSPPAQRTAAASSTPSSGAATPVSTPSAASSAAAAGNCGAQVKSWYLQFGKTQITNFHAGWAAITAPGVPLAARMAEGQGFEGSALPGQNTDYPPPACGDPGHAWATAMAYFVKAGTLVHDHPDGAIVPAAIQNAKSGFASLATVAGEVSKYTPAQP